MLLSRPELLLSAAPSSPPARASPCQAHTSLCGRVRTCQRPAGLLEGVVPEVVVLEVAVLEVVVLEMVNPRFVRLSSEDPLWRGSLTLRTYAYDSSNI